MRFEEQLRAELFVVPVEPSWHCPQPLFSKSKTPNLSDAYFGRLGGGSLYKVAQVAQSESPLLGRGRRRGLRRRLRAGNHCRPVSSNAVHSTLAVHE